LILGCVLLHDGCAQASLLVVGLLRQKDDFDGLYSKKEAPCQCLFFSFFDVWRLGDDFCERLWVLACHL
jgi:hypothetical protein